MNARRARAAREGRRIEKAFFANNPQRTYWVRQQVDHEYEDLPEEYEVRAVLVFFHPQGECVRLPMTLKVMPPDDEKFLSLLFWHVMTMRISDSPTTHISPEDHARLLEKAGLPVIGR